MRLLDEREGAQTAVIRGVERPERVVVAIHEREIARALEIDHRLGRVRRACLLERRERLVVAPQLALRLRDSQQAEAVLGIGREDLAVLADRVFPAALLERELGGVGYGRGCLIAGRSARGNILRRGAHHGRRAALRLGVAGRKRADQQRTTTSNSERRS